MRRGLSLGGWPRLALFLALPVVAFAIAAGVTLGTTSRNDSKVAAPTTPPSVDVAVSRPPPTATLLPYTGRTDCNAIRGTAYSSDAEREWFRLNCGPATPTPPPGATPRPGASPSSTPPGTPPGTPPSTPAGTPAATAVRTAAPPPTSTARAGASAGLGATEPGTPAANASGAQIPTADRLVIPAIGVDADVSRAAVDGRGSMPNPAGYFNVVWYDFGAFPGLGGYVTRGNLVLGGYVDCTSCRAGRGGAAVFANVRNLQPGDTAQYTAEGFIYSYVVTSAQDYSTDVDLGKLVSSAAADMTLITFNGTLDSAGREYTSRRVVVLKRA